MKVHIGIDEKNRKEAGGILNTLLADEVMLYVKTRNYHWNVVGSRFHDLHKFFESQYEALDEIMDDVAERARAVGSKSEATLVEFSKKSRISEHPGKYPDADSMLENLLSDHEEIIRHLRKDADTVGNKLEDAGTNDFLVGLMEQHEKMAWMLRSFLEK